jgi:hypothetical protein
MFPFPIAKPQGCDIQTFYGSGSGVLGSTQRTWNKPVGVSHVYMMLIGAGGDGDGSIGGGSGAVTVWYGAAQHVPNSLVVSAAANFGSSTTVRGRFRSSALVDLLTASSSGGSGGLAGVAMTANYFTASGFFKSTAGQAGTSGNITASTTTFLSGGGGSNTFAVTANYGYSLPTVASTNGFFITQPIIVGLGGKGLSGGGVGCGGGGEVSGRGGPGMVLIASW